MSGPLLPRNAESLDKLEREAASHLAGMARASLMGGAMPPKSVMDWYGLYAAEALVATESMAQQVTRDTPQEDLEMLDAQLEMCISALADILAQCTKHKMWVLQEKIMGVLKARALHLPLDFDTSYKGAIPKV